MTDARWPARKQSLRCKWDVARQSRPATRSLEVPRHGGGHTVTHARDTQLDADLAAAQRSSRRQALILGGIIGLIGASSAIGAFTDPGRNQLVAIGQGLTGLLGVAAAALTFVRPRQAWLLAMAWALIQIPFYAWTPDGSVTTQALYFPLTATQSTMLNGVLTSYSSMGINVAGIIFAVWLRAWRSRFEA